MPVRNTVRLDVSDQYYHVYNRGLNFQPIFLENSDKDYFLQLLKRYLSPQSPKEASSFLHESFAGKLELNSYCLMGNHYHFLFYQNEEGALSRFMRAITKSYVRYFNKKYDRRGPLFESRYKASLIDSQVYLVHISRYIHLNPNNWRTYAYSSLAMYQGIAQADWLQPQRILEIFSGENYLDFVSDYEDHKKMLEELKYELADSL